MTLSDMARSDLLWGTENITTSCNTATHGTPQDARRLSDWQGGVLNSISTRGQWSEDQSKHYINYLGILACFRIFIVKLITRKAFS